MPVCLPLRSRMERSHWVLAAGLVFAAVMAGAWFGRGPSPPPPPLEERSVGAPALTVHVAGMVVSPGLVEVAGDARIADAIAAAGGTRPGADVSALNLAAPVGDGQQIVVPAAGERDLPERSDGRIRVNSASPEELEALPGVGPVLATRIAAYREENGPFATVEDLLDVPGIGEGKLATLRDAVVVP